MDSKEIIIDKNINLSKIDCKTYSKLILKSKIRPNRLKKFINVKELTIVSEEINTYDYNEYNINKLPFISNLEKLTFKNIQLLGKKTNFKGYYSLNTYTLKSIEIPTSIYYINKEYIMYCKKLEEIIFNVTNSINFDYLIVDSKYLKKIKIKYLDKEYVLNVDDYFLDGINRIEVDNENQIIKLTCRNEIFTTKFSIDIGNDIVKKYVVLDASPEKLIENSILNIPDFVNVIELGRCDQSAKELSFNIKILENMKERYDFFLDSDLKYLEKVILRKNNEMNLFPNEVFDTNLYGKFNYLFIENQELHIVYDNLEFIVDKSGNIKKREFIMKEIEKEINLNNYSLTELEEYLCYKKLLLSIKENDKEFIDAMNVLEGRIIKRLMKNR